MEDNIKTLFILSLNKTIIYNFGRYKNNNPETINENNHIEYLKWILKNIRIDEISIEIINDIINKGIISKEVKKRFKKQYEIPKRKKVIIFSGFGSKRNKYNKNKY